MVKWPLKRESSLLQGRPQPFLISWISLKIFWNYSQNILTFPEDYLMKNFEEKKDHLRRGAPCHRGDHSSLFLNISPTTQTTQTTKTTQPSNHPIVSRVALWCPRTEIKVSLAQLLAFSWETFLLSFVSTWNTNKLDWWLHLPNNLFLPPQSEFSWHGCFLSGPRKQSADCSTEL